MDKNLKLTIIDSLISNGLIQFNRDIFLHETCRWTKYKTKRFYDKPIPEILEYFLSIELGKYPLHKIIKLYQSGINEINYLIWNGWDGETDYFDIKTLEGVDQMPNLNKLILGTTMINDLTPLISLCKLKEVSIISTNIIQKVEILLEIKTLEKVEIQAPFPKQDKNHYSDIENALKNKGVTTSIISKYCI